MTTTTIRRTNIFAGLNRTTGERKHILFDRPYLQLLVLPAILWLIGQIGGSVLASVFGMIPVVNSNLAFTLGAVLTVALLLVANKLYFKGQVPVNVGVHGLGKALLLGFPMYGAIVWNAMGTNGTTFALSAIIAAVLNGLAIGAIEETAFRAITLAHGMKGIKKEYEILVLAALSSTLFGSFHLLNLTTGAALVPTILQVISATGLGLLFTAIYLRTGNILATILFHGFFNAAADLAIGQGINVLTIGGIDMLQLILTIIFIAYALFLLRKSKRVEILNSWKEKFAEAR